MSTQPSPQDSQETTFLGTVGWIGVTVVLALAALVLLNWLGPLGGR